MGLFSFLKNVGKNRTPEVKEPTAAEVKAQNLKLAQLIYDSIKEMNFDVEGLTVTVDGDQAIIRGSVKEQSVKELIILETGNTVGISQVEDYIEVAEQEEELIPRFYEVQRGDSLSKIAKHFYGDYKKYPAIFEANRPMLSDPDKIYPGQTLRIPENIA